MRAVLRSEIRCPGEVTEWSIVRHWKCRVRVKLHRGFESHPLRLITYEPIIYVASHAGGTWLNRPGLIGWLKARRSGRTNLTGGVRYFRLDGLARN